MKQYFFQCIALLWLVLASTTHSLAEGPARPEPETMQRLLAGEVVLLDASSAESGGAGRAQALTFGSAKAYWDVIVSCELAFVFVDGLLECEVLEDSGDHALVRQVVKKHWLVPKQEFVFESKRLAYRQITFMLVEGDLDVLEGGWSFTPLPEGMLVDYSAHIKPRMPVPRFLVSRTIRKDTPDLMACIRGLATGSGSEKANEDDLARCPGKLPIDQ